MHPKFTKRTFSIAILIGFMFLFSFTLTLLKASAEEDLNSMETIDVEYFIDPNCDSCIAKLEWFYDVETEYQNVNLSIIEVIYSGESSNLSIMWDYTKNLGLGRISPPAAIISRDTCHCVLAQTNLTRDNIFKMVDVLNTFQGGCPDWDKIINGENELTLPLAFVSGLVSGLSPCVVLVTSFISSALVLNEGKKKKMLPLFTGFTLGILLMYALLTVALITTLSAFTSTFFSATIRYVFAGLMFILGAWYLLDAYNENSRLFKTPEKIKSLVVSKAKKGTFLSSFILGFIFSFIKIPCMGAVMSALIYSVAEDPSQHVGELIVFYIGLVIPLIILMILLAKGLQKAKVDEIRVKYRPFIRYLSGILIIGLTYYTIWDILPFNQLLLMIPFSLIAISPFVYLHLQKFKVSNASSDGENIGVKSKEEENVKQE